MKETNDFLMPEYYPNFACKQGECRTACCVGWPIAVSLENYFRLLGMECSEELRRRLDVGLRMTDNPTPEHYACFNPRFDGNCPMRLENGLCSIHAETGEDTLPDICRLYPRGIRTDGVRECSCANSCEAVSEIFLRMRGPLRFFKQKIMINVPDNAYDQRHIHSETEQMERMGYIAVLQYRKYSLSERLMRLRARLNGSDPDSAVLTRGNRDCGVRMTAEMVKVLSSHHDSFADYGNAAAEVLGADGETYAAAEKRFSGLFPDWEIYFEHLFVNHIFFSRFPENDRNMKADDVWKSMAVMYAILRYAAVGYMAARDSESDLVDAVSGCFRMIDHTEFEPYAELLLRKLFGDSDEITADLLAL